jgi:Leucine-rich repeat (LRR) protein
MNYNSISYIIENPNLDISSVYLDSDGNLSQAEEAVPLGKTKLLCDQLKKITFPENKELKEKINHLVQLATQHITNEFYEPLSQWVKASKHADPTSIYKYEDAERKIKKAFETQSTDLNLDGKELLSLPDALGHLTQLHKLWLGDNRLTFLPDSFGNLTQLKLLWIDSNQLSALPDSFGNLAHLEVLEIENNRLTALPDSFGNLAHLEVLEIENNQLTALPDSFGNLTQLQFLWLQINKLTALPDSFCNLTKLEDLRLERNELTTLPDSFGNLTQLNTLRLASNYFTLFPDSFSNLTQLQKLWLWDNPFAIEQAYQCLLYFPQWWDDFHFHSNEALALKAQFDANPESTKKSIGLTLKFHVDLYSLVVLLSDKFITLRPVLSEESHTESKQSIRRFFQIAEKLPLELQQVLANRAYASGRDFITSRDFEARFRNVHGSVPAVAPPS